MSDIPGASDPTGAAEQLPLLATKLYIPPARSSLVPRPRLTRRLDSGLVLKLILISAPAGSGKTTLLSEWRTGPPSSDTPFAWLSLDEGDNDPARFWSYVVAALQRIQPDIGEGLRALFHTGQSPPAEMAMTLLINDVTAFSQDFVLVLDDYHLIHTESIHQALIYLLDHLPPQMHLAIASRAEPPLPLPRWRGRGQMVEINAADLRFTAAEAASFLNQMMGLELSADQIGALEARTEGWIAGLQMAALSLQRLGQPDLSAFIDSFSGGHRYIVDYLVQEVLQRQPQEVQEFLLQTSVLHRLCGPLCDALTGRGDGQAMLQRLETANLFMIPLDAERQWYRYHHLFGEVLRKRLQQTEPEGDKEMLRRAFAWYEQQGFIVEAVDHALAAAEYDTAARLMEQNFSLMRGRGQMVTLRGWLEVLPPELVRSQPRLCVIAADIISLTAYDFAVVESYLQDAERGLSQVDPLSLPPVEVQHIRGRIAARRVDIAARQANISRTLEQAALARQLMPEEDIFHRQEFTGLVGAAYLFNGEALAAERVCMDPEYLEPNERSGGLIWSLIQWNCGNLRRAMEILRGGIEYMKKISPLFILAPTNHIGTRYVKMGETLYQWNDLDAARRYALDGVEIHKQWHYLTSAAYGYFLLARIYLAQGDTQPVYGIIDQLGQWAHTSPPDSFWSKTLGRGSIDAMQARLHLLLGNLPAASRWAQASDLRIDDQPDYLKLFDHLVLARVSLAQGQPAAALRLLPRLLNHAEIQGRGYDIVQILALQALALQAQGEIKQALETLQRALSLAEPEGYIRTFIDEGQPMRELLLQVGRLQVEKLQVEKLAGSGATPVSKEYLDRLLAAFDAPPAQASQHTNLQTFQPSNSPLAEPLSERELEVLRLIAGGLSNREIGAQLHVTVGTVKNHANAIFGKLEVSSRTQAAARARELGLLDM
ncbi:MAG: hypothetical protein HY326_09255 [Chloroflexi bacterium]|nr:hypothetical protein [Chloroflexota bacterium]